MNIKAAEELNANESNTRNNLKVAFPPRIATPSSLYPPGIAMMAENVTPATIVATTKLMLIMLLMSSCEKMCPFFAGCRSSSISVGLEVFAFISVLSFAFAGTSVAWGPSCPLDSQTCIAFVPEFSLLSLDMSLSFAGTFSFGT